MPPMYTKTYFNNNRRNGLNASIGNYTYGIPKIMHIDGDPVNLTIGNYCSIADGVKIYVGRCARHPIDFISTYPLRMIYEIDSKYVATNKANARNLDVNIGHDVWIGDSVMIMSGVTIGTGAIIGAKSLVLNDVAPYAVVGGVPSKLIKYRFDEDVISSLLALKWWDWPEEKMRDNIAMFFNPNIRDVVDAYLSGATTPPTD